MRLVVVTGVSGAGKSTALRALEDLGFYASTTCRCRWCPKFIELLASRPDVDRAALGSTRAAATSWTGRRVDLRRGCARRGHSVEVLFLDASDEILIRRFSETRRRHPLSGTDIRAGLAAERQHAGRPAAGGERAGRHRRR